LRALTLPALVAPSRADNVPAGPLVVVTEKAIVVDGRAMVVIADKRVDPAAIADDGLGRRIGPIATWADSWSKTPAAAASDAVLVAIDPALPSGLALDVILSFLPSKQRSFAFVVRTPDGPGTLPLLMPTAPPPKPTDPAVNPDDLPVQLVVTLTPDRVVLWSMSGLEGTLANPKLELTPPTDATWLARLRDDLTDLAKRRWGGRTQPEDQKTIVVMVDANVASGDLVNVIGAVRSDAKGNPLFPDVRLSTGFDEVARFAARKPDPLPPPPPEPARDQAVALEEEAVRYAQVLAMVGEDTGGISGDMSKRAPGGDLAAQIEAVKESGGQVQVGGGASRGTRGDSGDLRPGMGAGPRTDGPGAIDVPTGRIAIASKSGGDDTSLTADVALRKIHSVYMTGLKRCYKDQLKQDPTMRARITLGFTVNEMGGTVDAKVTGSSDELDGCIHGLISNWRFPVPKDADGEATSADLRFTFQLVPE
jgi:hypothetical protein